MSDSFDSGGKMRTNVVRLLIPLALGLSACSRGAADSAALSDGLKQDLAAASAAKIELANGSAAYKPMRFVSDIEQTNVSAPVQRAPAPRRVPVRSAAVEQDRETSPAPASGEVVQVAQTATEVAPSSAPEAGVPSVPIVSPRPSALPVDVPFSQGDGRSGAGIGMGRGEGRGMGIGDVIGVVIRGGGVGEDHCVPRRRGGRGFPRMR